MCSTKRWFLNENINKSKSIVDMPSILSLTGIVTYMALQGITCLTKVLKRTKVRENFFRPQCCIPNKCFTVTKRTNDSKDLFSSCNLKYIAYKKKMTHVISWAFPSSVRPFRRAFAAALVIFFHIHLTGLTCLKNHENTDVIAFRQH